MNNAFSAPQVIRGISPSRVFEARLLGGAWPGDGRAKC